MKLIGIIFIVIILTTLTFGFISYTISQNKAIYITISDVHWQNTNNSNNPNDTYSEFDFSFNISYFNTYTPVNLTYDFGQAPLSISINYQGPFNAGQYIISIPLCCGTYTFKSGFHANNLDSESFIVYGSNSTFLPNGYYDFNINHMSDVHTQKNLNAIYYNASLIMKNGNFLINYNPNFNIASYSKLEKYDTFLTTMYDYTLYGFALEALFTLGVLFIFIPRNYKKGTMLNLNSIKSYFPKNNKEKFKTNGNNQHLSEKEMEKSLNMIEEIINISTKENK